MNAVTTNEGFISATLPIGLEDGLLLDPVMARSFGEALSARYQAAKPYPHIVIDDFLPEELANRILAQFPSAAQQGDKLYDKDYTGAHKRQIAPIDCNAYLRNVFAFLNAAPILQFLEGLTGIQGLIADPYYNGGGFHEISRGGRLGIHADFRINEQLRLSRRLNMLIYLNRDWQAEYGGNLEIWQRDMKRRAFSIPPLFNRCVIFNTDKDSYHGHPDPLNTPADITRRSIALYYYTASERIYEELPAHTTMYAARPDDDKDIKAQVASFNRRNYLRDWLPPILIRGLSRLGVWLKHR